VAEVDLEYPPWYQDLHDDYPLAPFKRELQEQDISSYSREVVAVNARPFQLAHKLVATLEGRESYVVHHRALRAYLEHGMKIKRVHSVLWFGSLC
jgi:hypothetical protein